VRGDPIAADRLIAFARLKLSQIQTGLPTWQAEGSSAFAKVPGPSKARAAASDLCGRPPHLS